MAISICVFTCGCVEQCAEVTLFSPSSLWESSATGPGLHLLVLRCCCFAVVLHIGSESAFQEQYCT